MAIDVSWVEATVPAATGTLDGGGTITTPPPPITGLVRASSVPTRTAVGRPALLMSTKQFVAARSVARVPLVGRPAASAPGQIVATIKPTSVPRKLTWYTFFFGRIGRPRLRSWR
jgi:hypothetical protein